MLQIPAVRTQTQPTALYSHLKIIMDWNHSSFTLKSQITPYMETAAMVQHSVADTTFTSPTLQATTRILTATWVMGTSNWQVTDMALVTREACSQEVIISSLMKWKYFIRLTRTDITWPFVRLP